MNKSRYNKYPVVRVTDSSADCDQGWTAIGQRLKGRIQPGRYILCVETYPGCFEDEVERELVRSLNPVLVLRAGECYLPESAILALCERDLGDDPVFGFMNRYLVSDFLDETKVARTRAQLARANGLVIVIGTGASLIAEQWDLLVYCDMARWELQLRQRAGEIANLGLSNFGERPALKYKRGFFVDWRAADRLKKSLLPGRIEFLLDTNQRNAPKMISGEHLLRGLSIAAKRPFRVVPFFDPGPWGGQWMKEVCDLPRDVDNYAWCFDCVPEENSLLLGFGDVAVEIPSIDLVFQQPRELLGDAVHARFGTEFPIRFDFLDTMDGGNLSFQVHPLTEYIQEKFGMHYTQDESYYLLDATEEGCVYLGLKEGIDREQMISELREAQSGGYFDAEKYVNKFPAKKHDHFLIPAGTAHCSGRNSMVLEISATPYIFTFKLWDWGRLGLDGLPRPIHLEHGLNNVQWDRTTGWVKENLINDVTKICEGDGWVEERTGLHKREFIETRRHWFTERVPHDTAGGVNVLNLCEGEEAIVESPSHRFPPLVVHYAETFIIPASVGQYTIRPHGPSEGKRCATIKAFVRTKP